MTNEREGQWAQARALCRLSAEGVRMAKELGLNPRKLIKNIPNVREPWKAPVRVWVREIYRKRFEKKTPGGGKEKTLSRPAERGGGQAAAAPADERLYPSREGPRDAADRFSEEELEGLWDSVERPRREEADEENQRLLRRQEEFRIAADYVAAAFARLAAVEKITLFGSVACPLRKELPRFRKFRRAGVPLWHECKDMDLAVWLSDLDSLKALQRARGRALNELFDDAGIGVAHHQVDVFIMERRTDRYLGRLCDFGICPKGKPECRVPGCGATLFLRQHEDFVLDPGSLDRGKSVTLYDRAEGVGPPSLAGLPEDIPF